MKREILSLCLAITALLGTTISAQAADLSVSTGQTDKFYGSTSYNEVYDSQYNYAGQNQINYKIPEIQFGLSQQFLEQSLNNPYLTGTIRYGLSTGTPADVSKYPVVDFSQDIAGGDSFVQITYQPVATVADLTRKDGSIGTVSISRVGLSAKVYEGAGDEQMAKGAGHYPGTGIWTGNISLFGHNRGSHPYFGQLKDVRIGDTITYKTVLGTKTYTVTYVGVISNTDYSWLNEMGDNRITMFTCIANQPSLRLCVQAVES